MTQGLSRTRAAVLLAVALVLGTAAGLLAVADHASAQQSQCSNVVVHDAFRHDNATVDAAANTSASSRVSNTQASVEQATGFVRVSVENPNGYCVEASIRLASEVVSPAELGRIDATESNETADWHAVHDFERDDTYTEVVVTMPANSTATFAPSEVRVHALKWTGTAKDAGSGLFNVSWPSVGPFGDDDGALDQRTYSFSPENENTTEYVTVPLANESDGREVEDWHAVYRVNDSMDWRPVSQESTSPVFYRSESGDRVQFVFNDPAAEIEFTANPSWSERARYEWQTYTSGIDVLGDLLDVSSLFSATPMPTATEGFV